MEMDCAYCKRITADSTAYMLSNLSRCGPVSATLLCCMSLVIGSLYSLRLLDLMHEHKLRHYITHPRHHCCSSRLSLFMQYALSPTPSFRTNPRLYGR